VRPSTAAERAAISTRDIKFPPLRIFNHEIPRNAHRTIVGNRDSSTGHACSPLVMGYKGAKPARLLYTYTRFAQWIRVVPWTTGTSATITNRTRGKSVPTDVKLPTTSFTTETP